MKHHRYFHSWRALWIVVLALALAVPLIAPAAAQDTEKISRPGVYEGYSEPIYDGWSRTSQYITVRDGTRLAVDIFRPTQHGVVVDDPLPVIWTQHRYHRANVDSQGRVVSLVDQVPGLQMVIRYGYVVGVADVRGGGASFGTRRGEFSPEETWDSYDLTEWFAAQPWCSGNVGMFGLSYLAITQYMAASTKPPHLKAIFPMMAVFICLPRRDLPKQLRAQVGSRKPPARQSSARRPRRRGQRRQAARTSYRRAQRQLGRLQHC
jgi:putative CocE/NonD family hydrolase